MYYKKQSDKMLKSNSGMSLMEVTISLGILGIMTLAFTTMITNQQQQVQRLELKSTMLETQTQIISALSKDTVCTNQFSNMALGALKTTDGANGKINLTGATADMGSPLTTKLQLNKVLLGDVAGSAVALEVGQDLPGVRNNPVGEIYISDFVKKSASDDTDYTANLYAKFETNPKFGVMKPIKVKMNLKTDTAAITSRAVASCSAVVGTNNDGGGGGLQGSFGGIYSWHYRYKRCESDNPFTGGCNCPPGFNAKRIIRNGTDDGSKGDDQEIYFCFK